jgi:hypothetical protein
MCLHTPSHSLLTLMPNVRCRHANHAVAAAVPGRSPSAPHDPMMACTSTPDQPATAQLYVPMREVGFDAIISTRHGSSGSDCSSSEDAGVTVVKEEGEEQEEKAVGGEELQTCTISMGSVRKRSSRSLLSSSLSLLPPAAAAAAHGAEEGWQQQRDAKCGMKGTGGEVSMSGSPGNSNSTHSTDRQSHQRTNFLWPVLFCSFLHILRQRPDYNTHTAASNL